MPSEAGGSAAASGMLTSAGAVKKAVVTATQAMRRDADPKVAIVFAG